MVFLDDQVNLMILEEIMLIWLNLFSRYNLLFTQALNILVPCNLDLKAGNVIKCELPRIQEGQSREIDLELSGYYLIKEVRHHIEVGEVTTSLKLIRDSYGFKVPTST